MKHVKHFQTLRNVREVCRRHVCLKWVRGRVNYHIAKNLMSAKNRLERNMYRDDNCAYCHEIKCVREDWVFGDDGLQVIRHCCLCLDIKYVSEVVNY